MSAWGKEAGLELEEVKALLRHENIATTSEVYGGLDLAAKRRIQERLVSFAKHRADADGWTGDAHSPKQVTETIQ